MQIPRLRVPGSPTASPASAPTVSTSPAPEPDNTAPARVGLRVPAAMPAIAPRPPIVAPRPAAPPSYVVAAPSLGRDDLDRIAGANVRSARDGVLGGAAVSVASKRSRDAVAIGTRVVGAMRSQARAALARDADGADADAIAALWGDLVAGLADMGLHPTIYCGRSGRLVHHITAAHMADYLGAVARIGDNRAGDAALGAVQDALLVQIGNTILPQHLTTSADRLAFEREFLPVDFLIRGLGKLFPAPRDNLGRAIHCQRLGALRLQASALPPAVVHYLCEVLTLHLAHVDCATLPKGQRIDALFPGGDWSRALFSVSAAGHLSGRMVQHIFGLLAARDNKPLDRLSRFDLLHLRTAHRGHPEYGGIYRRTRAQYSNLARAALVSGGMSRASLDLLDAADALQGMGGLDFGMSDLLDLQAAAAMAGHSVGVHLQTQAELARAQQVRAASIQAAQSARFGLGDDNAGGGGADDDNALASLDLSALLAADYLPDDFLTFDDERDLLRSGILTADEFLDAQEDVDEDEDEGEDAMSNVVSLDDLDNLQAELIASAIAAASPVKFR